MTDKQHQQYEQYEHYGAMVWVNKALLGQQRGHCLCWACGKFLPDDRIANCPIANLVHAVCVREHLVLPVWECPAFVAYD